MNYEIIETLCDLLRRAIDAIQDESLKNSLQEAFDEAMGEVVLSEGSK